MGGTGVCSRWITLLMSEKLFVYRCENWLSMFLHIYILLTFLLALGTTKYWTIFDIWFTKTWFSIAIQNTNRQILTFVSFSLSIYAERLIKHPLGKHPQVTIIWISLDRPFSMLELYMALLLSTNSSQFFFYTEWGNLLIRYRRGGSSGYVRVEPLKPHQLSSLPLRRAR